MSPKPISVLITGANRGLGLEMVKQMVNTQGLLSVLFATCRDPEGEKAQALQALGKQHPDIIKIIRMDAADPKSIKQAAEQVGKLLGKSGLNLLINNAGITHHSDVWKSTPEEILDCYRTNTVGPLCITQEFLPYLRIAAKDSGMPGMSCRKAAVVNISSLLGSIEFVKRTYPKRLSVPYRASKAALHMLMVCASVELQKEEILCTLLRPGWVRTEMGGPDADIDAQESVQEMLKVMNSMTEKDNGEHLDYNGKNLPW